MAGLNFEEMEKYLDWWYDFSMSNPQEAWCPMLISMPGIGKTSLVEELAAKKGVKLKVLILSQANPTEVAGMTMPSPDGRHETYIYDPAWVSELKDGDILFLDEVLKAPQAVLNSCLTMIQSRIMASGTKLPKIAIISAANESKTAQNYPDELKQRFVQVNLNFDLGMYLKYMYKRFPKIEEMKSLKDHFEFFTARYLPAGCPQGWNRFTPRDCTKITAATMACKSPSDFDTILYPALISMYGRSIADSFSDFSKILHAPVKLTKREQLEQILLETGDHSLIKFVEAGKSMNDADFVWNLSQNSYWEELTKMLAGLDLVTDEIPY